MWEGPSYTVKSCSQILAPGVPRTLRWGNGSIRLGLQLLGLWEVADPALGHSVEVGSEAEEFQATDELRGEGGACPGRGLPHQGSSKGHRCPGERRTAGDVGCVGKGWQTLTCDHRVGPRPCLWASISPSVQQGFVLSLTAFSSSAPSQDGLHRGEKFSDLELAGLMQTLAFTSKFQEGVELE